MKHLNKLVLIHSQKLVLHACLSILLLCCTFQSHSQIQTIEEIKQKKHQKAVLAKENTKDFFSFMFFDAGAAAEFNILDDNGLANFIGNRKLRQTIDYFKEKTGMGVCVRCYVNSEQRWAKMLNFKTAQGNCDSVQGNYSLIFDIALEPVTEGKDALYKPIITYRTLPGNGYSRKIKTEHIEIFEEYMRNDSSNAFLTSHEFIPKLNDKIITALLKLLGNESIPILVDFIPKGVLAYDSCLSAATQKYYEQIDIHGTTSLARWVSVEKGKPAIFTGEIKQFIPDSTEKQMQLKRNNSVQQIFKNTDTLLQFTVNGFSNGENTVKAAYQLEDNKGVDILAGQINVAAYKKETFKLVIVPIQNTTLPDVTIVKRELDRIYSQALINWDVVVDIDFKYDKAINIDLESTGKEPYDKTMKELIAAYPKAEKKARYIFLINNFGNNSGANGPKGYMPYQQKYGFVAADKKNIARTIAHELGHGAFGLKHSFLPEYGIADIYGNLMGYGDSSYLCKFQWDIIHNSKAGETAFDTVSDVMLTTRDECSKYIEILKESRTKGKKLPLNLHKDSIYVSENIKIDTFTYKKITLYVDNARNADVEEVDMSSTELYKREGAWSVYGKDYHFIIRPYRIMLTFKTEKERDVMFDYLGGEKDEEEEYLLKNIQWVHQFDKDYFKNETCWSKECCNKASNKILELAGTSTSRANQKIIAETTEKNCSNIKGNDNFEKALKIINISLKEHQLPIMIGVNHPKWNDFSKKWENKCSYSNTPLATNHYIVIIGSGYDQIKKQKYYIFYEVGTKNPTHGKSKENKLYINEKNKIIIGKTSYITNNDEYYTVMEVRKNNGQIYNIK